MSLRNQKIVYFCCFALVLATLGIMIGCSGLQKKVETVTNMSGFT